MVTPERQSENPFLAAKKSAIGALTDYNDIVLDHIDPKGMGGAWRDDHPDNIQGVHYWCNGEKGSTRMDG